MFGFKFQETSHTRTVAISQLIDINCSKTDSNILRFQLLKWAFLCHINRQMNISSLVEQNQNIENQFFNFMACSCSSSHSVSQFLASALTPAFITTLILHHSCQVCEHMQEVLLSKAANPQSSSKCSSSHRLQQGCVLLHFVSVCIPMEGVSC